MAGGLLTVRPHTVSSRAVNEPSRSFTVPREDPYWRLLLVESALKPPVSYDFCRQASQLLLSTSLCFKFQKWKGPRNWEILRNFVDSSVSSLRVRTMLTKFPTGPIPSHWYRPHRLSVHTVHSQSALISLWMGINCKLIIFCACWTQPPSPAPVLIIKFGGKNQLYPWLGGGGPGGCCCYLRHLLLVRSQ